MAEVTDLAALEGQIKADVTAFVVGIQTSRVVDVAAGKRLAARARDVARALKGRPLVSKSLLNELHVTTRILRAEAPYIKDRVNAEFVIEIANKLREALDLILLDECHDDRLPGTSRIV